MALDQKGILAPVANPEGVAALLAIAFAASRADDPPPRILALVKRRRAASRSDVEPPSNAALSAARNYAQQRGVAIEARAVWSDSPESDIIAAAQQAKVAWTLLGYHREASGSDTMGGVVREVFERARSLPFHVGAFIQGTDRPLERVFAAVDASPDGRAALDLAVRIVSKNKCKLRALLVSDRATEQHDDLLDMIREAGASLGRLVHTDVLTQRSLHQLFRQSPGRLLIVGRNFANEVHLPLDEVPGGDRSVIVVQGAMRISDSE